ncbi:hypothetical protein CsSME_00023420 [Camellia sinensis var. sinensis]
MAITKPCYRKQLKWFNPLQEEKDFLQFLM